MTEPDYPRNRLRATAGFLTSGQDIRARCTGRFPMAIILHELLLFSCLAALVTGIVIAAASLL